MTTSMAQKTETASPATEMLDRLERWVEQGWLRRLDAAFAGFLAREAPEADSLLILAAALVSHQLGRGHTCLDLVAASRDPAAALALPPDDGVGGGERPGEGDLAALVEGLDPERWLEALDCPSVVGSGAGDTPLVREEMRLYLRRYWQYEQDVRAGIAARVAASADLANTLSMEMVRATLDVLFPAREGVPVDWQKLACALAARSAFSIVTGGPGTGKTTTVVRLLALLQAIALSGKDGAPLRIRLAAPTGKAAARLNESIAGVVDKLQLDGLDHANVVRKAIPLTVTTLHRLLGKRPDSRRFRHDASNLLALDVLVIDEASMVDLEMAAAVLAALPPSSRLILLGDKDQLASVEAGALLGQLCRRAHEGHYTRATADWLEEITGQSIDAQLIDPAGTPLDQAIAMLRHSHRFGAESGIGRLAGAVNAGKADDSLGIVKEGGPDLQYASLEQDGEHGLAALVTDGMLHGARADDAGRAGAAGPGRHGYRHYLDAVRNRVPVEGAGLEAYDEWASAVLAAHASFQVLCALRRGRWGVQGLNQRIARILHEAGLIPATESWYPGRPVLVTRNDYALGLMNGDIGIVLSRPDEAGAKPALRVAFPAGDGSGPIKWVSPSRLEAVETVYALTVHKSQGSEFTHVALVLPDSPNPILTRELLYTGITRARSFLTLANAGDDALIKKITEKTVLRASGLMEAGLGGEPWCPATTTCAPRASSP